MFSPPFIQDLALVGKTLFYVFGFWGQTLSYPQFDNPPEPSKILCNVVSRPLLPEPEILGPYSGSLICVLRRALLLGVGGGGGGGGGGGKLKRAQH